MTKAEFIAQMSAKAGLTKVDTEKALDAFWKTVESNLTNGNDIQFVGMGTFKVTDRAEKDGFNPKTKEKIKIPASKSVSFKVGLKLKEAVKNK